MDASEFRLLTCGDTIWDTVRGMELKVVYLHKVSDPEGIEDTEYRVDAQTLGSQLYVYEMSECAQLEWLRAIGHEREAARATRGALNADRDLRMQTLRTEMHNIISARAKDDQDPEKQWGLVHVRATKAVYLHELDLLADELLQGPLWLCVKNTYLSFLVDRCLYADTSYGEARFFASAGLAY